MSDERLGKAIAWIADTEAVRQDTAGELLATYQELRKQAMDRIRALEARVKDMDEIIETRSYEHALVVRHKLTAAEARLKDLEEEIMAQKVLATKAWDEQWARAEKAEPARAEAVARLAESLERWPSVLEDKRKAEAELAAHMVIHDIKRAAGRDSGLPLGGTKVGRTPASGEIRTRTFGGDDKPEEAAAESAAARHLGRQKR